MEAKLEASMKKLGCYKPIICRELEPGVLEILGGEHRARMAHKLGLASVPVMNLGRITDSQAKTIGLIDNGRYGEDDGLKLQAILVDLRQDGATDFLDLLPVSDEDLAGMFGGSDIDLDAIGFDPEDDKDDQRSLDEIANRPAPSHELMRFKVPIADRERIESFIGSVIKARGLSSEEDSMVAAGMALVEIVNAAQAAGSLL